MVEQALVIAWSRIHRRTVWLGKRLKAKILHIAHGPPYIVNAVLTIATLARKKPRLVIVQGTHGPLLTLVILYKFLMTLARQSVIVIVDVHSGFFIPFGLKSWFLTIPFNRLLRYADILILHDYSLAVYVRHRQAKLARIFVVFDPPVNCNCRIKCFRSRKSIVLVFPSGGLPDEPIKKLEETISELNGVKLFVTGPHKPSKRGNIVYTGFLKYNDYLKTLCAADAVLALTTLEYTIQGSAWEAISCGKPLIYLEKLALKMFKNIGVGIKELNKHALQNALEQLINNRNKICDEIKIFNVKYKRLHSIQLAKLLKAIWEALHTTRPHI